MSETHKRVVNIICMETNHNFSGFETRNHLDDILGRVSARKYFAFSKDASFVVGVRT